MRKIASSKFKPTRLGVTRVFTQIPGLPTGLCSTGSHQHPSLLLPVFAPKPNTLNQALIMDGLRLWAVVTSENGKEVRNTADDKTPAVPTIKEEYTILPRISGP